MKSTILQLAARILMLSAMSASASIRYVDVNSAGPAPPYTNWATAATTIQDAVDAAVTGDQILVTNGVYQAGERMAAGTMNRVAVNKPVIVRSVNGAAVTMIRGSQVPDTANVDSAIRCVYLTNGAALAGFTLTNGMASYGGGVWCESSSATVSNCVLTGNLAADGGGASGGTLYNCTLTGNSAHWVGGGAYRGTLYNCTLTTNSAGEFGGGALNCTLNNCTLTGNSARWGGGGAEASTLKNCIVYYNKGGDQNRDNYSGSSLSYSCITPFPEDGVGNLTNAPLFVDYLSGNLHLQSNSPCINSGANAFVPTGPDPDGNPRFVGGTVDMGAYEFQSPLSHVSYAWLQQYGLPTDGSADDSDTDGDGLNNGQEWRAGTSPTNALSVLHLFSPASAASGVKLSWQSVGNRIYFLERATELGEQPPFLLLATGLAGQPGTTTFMDTNAAGVGPYFYRIGVEE